MARDIIRAFRYIRDNACAAHTSQNGRFYLYNLHHYLQIDTDSDIPQGLQDLLDYVAEIADTTKQLDLAEWIILCDEREGEIVLGQFDTLPDVAAVWQHILVTGEYVID